MRVEKDSLGERRIDSDVYYGAQTDRALENFPISGLRPHPAFIEVYASIKKAACVVNAELGLLDKTKAKAIASACDQILKGRFSDQFVVDIYQMGAGTSIHMNVNEVIANIANEILGGKKGSYDRVNPNDDVNKGQSTNDTFPTAMRLSAALIARRFLHSPLNELERALLKKSKEFGKILKSGRTHLQDAVPIRLGQEFEAYSLTIKRCHADIAISMKALLEIGLGGSAAGTGLNTRAGYAPKVAKVLGGYLGLNVTPSKNLVEAMQSQRPISSMSAALRNLSLELTRIVNDLRLMSSGPTTGLGEIVLPSVAPGSSIMPGKVNPSILEMVNMVCYQVIGCDTTIAYAVQAGQLELNVMMPVMSANLNFSLRILGNAIKSLNTKCIKGLRCNKRQCQSYAERSMGLATALNPYIGYAKAAEVAKEALNTGKTMTEILRDKKLIPESKIRRILDPLGMTSPKK